MSPTMLKVIAPVVDTQPAWDLVVLSSDERFSDEERAFARFKALQAAKSMAEAAKGIRERLKELGSKR